MFERMITAPPDPNPRALSQRWLFAKSVAFPSPRKENYWDCQPRGRVPGNFPKRPCYGTGIGGGTSGEKILILGGVLLLR